MLFSKYEGGLAVAVPGELRGMQKAHKRYGKLKWKDLFQPAIELAEKGFPLSESCSIAVNKWKKDVLGEKCLRSVYYFYMIRNLSKFECAKIMLIPMFTLFSLVKNPIFSL